MYVITRLPGEFVARPTRFNAFTDDLLEAKVFYTEDEARAECCANERVVAVSELPRA